MTKRVEAIIKFPSPSTKKQLQSFLGMVNFYHRFLPNIAETLVPLHSCVVSCGSAKLITDGLWSSECAAAFSLAKKALSEATMLRHPSATSETRFSVDASQTALGACLEQKSSVTRTAGITYAYTRMNVYVSFILCQLIHRGNNH